MDNQNNVPYIIKPYKSSAVSILLTLFLGPIGLLYASFFGSIIMLILVLISIFIPKGGALLLSLSWLICFYWGVFSVNRYNKRIDGLFNL